MKKNWNRPKIIWASTPGDDVVIGGGTGQGNTDIYAVSYSEWLTLYAEDLIEDGEINEDDYAAWWDGQGFSREDWEILNPDLPWDEYFG